MRLFWKVLERDVLPRTTAKCKSKQALISCRLADLGLRKWKIRGFPRN